MPLEALPTARRQFKDDRCPQCGGNLPRRDYCDGCAIGRQQRGGHRELFDVTAFGDQRDPHMHKTCTVCGYEWLSETLAQESEHR